MDDDFTARAGEYWPRLTRTARLLTGNSADADRRARAALAEVYARRRLPGDDAEFYVRRALVRDFLRRRPRLLAVVRPGPGPEAAAGRGTGAGHRRGRGHAPQPYVADPLDPVTEVLASLTPRRRAVAVLRHWDGLTHRETAALLDSAPGSVKAVWRRAEKALRAHPAYREGPHDGSPPVPGPVPVAAVEAAGRIRRGQRRRTAALVTSVGALVLVPLVVGAVRGTDSGSGADPTPVARTAVRVVTPGERVAAASGVQFWLTKDGTHWSAPGQPNLFRDEGGTGEDGTEEDEAEKGAGLTLHADLTSGKRIFLSGVHRGTSEATRVELGTPDGTFTARVLTLAGSPGWSAWYVDTQLTGRAQALRDLTVTAYDSAGKLLARTEGPS
ncbi:sigma factor-like helix-turn-helix DNA-binding protein [Streptomyces sp. CWNU-52B]|uniref:sigma factor-like helix-turn-helix DNA-binding protein n=1 Tax=unclassified Streptomyces TaxID=2593676 RepID=UPI0039C36D89